MDSSSEEPEYWSWMADQSTILIDSEKEIGIPWILSSLFCNDFNYRFDFIDEITICLIDLVIKKRDQIAFLLPWYNKRRLVMLFASLIILNWLTCKKLDYRNSTILYIGNPSLVRHSFRKISLLFRRKDEMRRPMALHFSHFFLRQYTINSGEVQKEEGIQWDQHLPKIICHPSLSNIQQLIEKNNPDWIFIDFENDEKEIPFLQDAVKFIKDNATPLICVSENPLSRNVLNLKKQGVQVYSWPSVVDEIPSILSLPQGDNFSMEQIFINNHSDHSKIKPILIKTRYEKNFTLAYKALIQAREHVKSELGQNAIKIGFKYLRLLESLSIPLTLYEQECSNFWGLKNITSTKEAFDKYISAIEEYYPELTENLLVTSLALDQIYYSFWKNEPDLWKGLTAMINCTENSCPIITVFYAKGRQDLFELAILARLNITSEDLQEKNIFITSLKEISEIIEAINSSKTIEDEPIVQVLKRSPEVHIVLVGLPGYEIIPKLKNILTNTHIDILIYGHLISVIYSLGAEWNTSFTPDLINNATIMAKMLNSPPPSHIPVLNSRFKVDGPEILFKEKGAEAHTTKQHSEAEFIHDDVNFINLFEENEFDKIYGEDDKLSIAVTELEKELDSDFEPEVSPLGDINDEKVSRETSILLEKIFVFEFEEGFRAKFSPNDTLKLLNYSPVNGELKVTVIDSLAGSLNLGDKVLFIKGQKRQSLYDLLISQIHTHPAVEIKIALINRWHEEFSRGYERESKYNGLTVGKLLEDLMEHGSQITSPQTVMLWLQGATLCPSDPEDLLRIAKILNLPFVNKHYLHIYSAAQKIRGIHAGFSRRLNNWLLNQATGILQDADLNYDFIDEKLGVTLSDFKESLLVLTVRSVKEEEGLYCYYDLGKLEGV